MGLSHQQILSVMKLFPITTTSRTGPVGMYSRNLGIHGEISPKAVPSNHPYSRSLWPGDRLCSRLSRQQFLHLVACHSGGIWEINGLSPLKSHMVHLNNNPRKSRFFWKPSLFFCTVTEWGASKDTSKTIKNNPRWLVVGVGHKRPPLDCWIIQVTGGWWFEAKGTAATTGEGRGSGPGRGWM